MEQYLFTTYLQRHPLSVVCVTAYRRAARHFDRFFRRGIRRIQPADIERFARWLLSQGLSGDTVRTNVEIANAIARDWFPFEQWRQPIVLLYCNEPGTLDNVFAEHYMKRQQRVICDPDTRRRYGKTLWLFGSYLKRPAKLSDLTRKCVGAFLNWLAKNLSVARWTIAHHAQRIGALWRFAWRLGLVTSPPNITV